MPARRTSQFDFFMRSTELSKGESDKRQSLWRLLRHRFDLRCRGINHPTHAFGWPGNGVESSVGEFGKIVRQAALLRDEPLKLRRHGRLHDAHHGLPDDVVGAALD